MSRKNGNWTIKKTEKIYTNDFFTVYLDEVVEPDGKNGEYATINFKKSVCVVAVDDENNIFLTEQFRYALERNNIEAVSGAVEDEDFLAAAKRELKEEIGVSAESWNELGKVVSNTSLAKDEKHLFLARNLQFGKPAHETTEEIKTLKLKFEKALEMIMNGEISHDITCLLILKAERFLRLKSER